MNSNLNILYIKSYYGRYSIYIDDLLKNLYNKNQVLFKNKNNCERDNYCNNILFLKLFDLNYCNNCNNYSDYVGYCINHINKTTLEYHFDEFKKIFINIEKNYSKYINNYLNEIINYYTLNITKLSQILKYYEKNILCIYDFSINVDNTIYIDDEYNINYYKINTIFNDDKCHIVINDFYKKNSNLINIICLLTFLYKKYKYQKYLLLNMYNNKTITKTFIGNNERLYNYIFNSNIMHYVEYIETERNVKISNHSLRFDIYIIVKHGLKYLKLVIETDEKHHYNVTTNDYDILKDKYCIQNNISMLRLDICDTLTDNQLKFTLFFIKYLVEYGKPIYYFSNKYINSHIINNNKETNKLITFGSSKNNKNTKINIANIINTALICNDIKNIDFIIKNEGINELLNKFADESIIDINDDNYINDTKAYIEKNEEKDSIITIFRPQ